MRREARALHVLVEDLRQDVPGRGTAVLLDHLPLLEQQQRRDALHAVAGRERTVLVHVHLPDPRLAGVLLRQLLEDRRHDPAGPAPLGPEIDEDGRIRPLRLVVEIARRQFEDVLAAHRRSVPPSSHRAGGRFLYHTPPRRPLWMRESGGRFRPGTGFRPDAGFRPRRSLGQNFLVDGAAIEAIVLAFGPRPHDRVLEIGPGQGALTRRLAGRVERLVAVEVDPMLAAGLRASVAPLFPPGSLEILEADILALPPATLLGALGATAARPARVLANLPYNIATAVILALLPLRPAIADLMVMVQREVAERIRSRPAPKTYGSLSVLCQ